MLQALGSSVGNDREAGQHGCPLMQQRRAISRILAPLSHLSQSCNLGLVSVGMPSWGNAMRVYMVVAVIYTMAILASEANMLH